jgi:hypothetical protein
MTDDNVIRVPRVTRTGPLSAVSIWPPDEAGIVTATFHSLKIGKETPPTATDRRRPDHTAPCLAVPGPALPDLTMPRRTLPGQASPKPDCAGQAQMMAPPFKVNTKELQEIPATPSR